MQYKITLSGDYVAELFQEGRSKDIPAGAVYIDDLTAESIKKLKKTEKYNLTLGKVESDPVLVAGETRLALESELADLQLQLASKGFVWFLRYIVDNQSLPKGPDIPQKLKDAQARINEIELELGG